MSSNIVTVASFTDPPNAYLAKARLIFEGIQCWIADDNHINLKWTISSALGGVKLRVHINDVDDAIRVLSTDCSDDLKQVFPIQHQDQCSKCGSNRTRLVNYTRKFAALTLLTGLPFIVFLKRVKCLDCKHLMKNA